MLTLGERERRDPPGESSKVFSGLFRREKDWSFVQNGRDDLTDAFASQYECS